MIGVKSMGFLKQMASNSIMDFLIGLALLAMFDPNGDFLMSLIDMLVNIFGWLINAFISLIPKMVNLLLVVGPKIAAAIGKAIWALLTIMAKSLKESIVAIFNNPSGSNILGLILKLMFFGAILAKIFMPLIGIGMKAFSLFSTVYKAFGSLFGILKSAIGFIWSILTKIFFVIKLVASVIGWPITIVLLLIGLFVLLWNYSESFRNFIKKNILPVISSIWEGIKIGLDYLAEGFSWLWENVLSPMVDAMIAIFSFLWNYIWKPIGMALIAVFGFIWDNVLKPMFKGMWTLTKILYKAWVAVFDGFKSAISGLMSAGRAVIDFFANFSPGKLIGNIGDMILGAFRSAVSGISGLFNDMIQSLLKLLPKRLGGNSSAQVAAQESAMNKLQEITGRRVTKGDAQTLFETMAKSKDAADFAKSDIAKQLGADKNAELMKFLSTMADKVRGGDVQDNDENFNMLAEVFSKVGKDLKQELAKGDQASPLTEMKPLKPSKKD
jgi:hypothetical protein